MNVIFILLWWGKKSSFETEFCSMFVRITSKKIPVFEPSSIYFNYTDSLPWSYRKVWHQITIHTGNMEFRISLWVIRDGKYLPLCTALSSAVKKEAKCTLETRSEWNASSKILINFLCSLLKGTEHTHYVHCIIKLHSVLMKEKPCICFRSSLSKKISLIFSPPNKTLSVWSSKMKWCLGGERKIKGVRLETA